MPLQKHVMPLPPSQLCCALQEHKKPLGMITFGNISLICARPTMACIGLLVMSVLWNGVLGAPEEYTLTAPWTVTAQEGLCVMIPCKFTIEATLFCGIGSHLGFWFLEGARKDDPAVASNDEKKEIRADTRGRFRLVGDLNQMDCSLKIDGVRRSDARNYYFRYENSQSSSIKHSYERFSVGLTVVGLRDQPEIYLPQGMMEGDTVLVKCRAPGRCSGTTPEITWSSESHFEYVYLLVSEINQDGTNIHESTIEITASRDHNNKRLSCSVYFPAAGASSERSVFLNVGYAPAAPEIIQYDTEDWSGKQEKVSNKTIMEGRTLNMHCSVDSSPPANLSWIKGGETILKKDAINNLTLRLSSITFEDEGQYWCIATNIHGVTNSSVFISVLGVSPAAITGIVVASILLLALLVGVSFCVTRKIRKRGNTGNRNMSKASNDTTVDSTYQELQRRQSDTYCELKRDGK